MATPDLERSADEQPAVLSKTKTWTVLLGLVVVLSLGVGPAPDALSRWIMATVGSLNVASALLMSYLLVVLLAVYLPVLYWMRRQGFTYADVGLSRDNQRIAAIVVAILWGAFLGVGFFFSYQSPPPQGFGHADVAYTDWSWVRPFLMLTGTTVAVVEECIGRGLVFALVARAGHGTFMQVAVSSVMMAIYHTAWTLEPITFGIMCFQGVVFSLFYLWGRRTLVAVCLAHGLAHLVGDPWATYLIIETALRGAG